VCVCVCVCVCVTLRFLGIILVQLKLLQSTHQYIHRIEIIVRQYNLFCIPMKETTMEVT